MTEPEGGSGTIENSESEEVSGSEEDLGSEGDSVSEDNSSSEENSEPEKRSEPKEGSGIKVDSGPEEDSETEKGTEKEPVNNPIQHAMPEGDWHPRAFEEGSPYMPDKDFVPCKIMRRADWGAKKPKWIDVLKIPINDVVVSFTETDTCTTEEACIKKVKEIQEAHQAEDKVPDIKHNFMIGGDGVIYEGRGFTRMGPVYPTSQKHIEELNGKSVEIALIERSISRPPQCVVKALSFCVAAGVNGGYLNREFFTHYVVNNEIQYTQPSLLQKKLQSYPPTENNTSPSESSQPSAESNYSPTESITSTTEHTASPT